MDEKYLENIRKQIEDLPKGNITWKTIRGKSRMYLQWSEDGKQKSRYIKAAEQAEISAKIELRGRLEAELGGGAYADARQGMIREEAEPAYRSGYYYTNVTTGQVLAPACEKVSKFGRRECFSKLERYLNSDLVGRVCLIFGLRRTGKTTIIMQAIHNLPKEQTAYIKIMTNNTMAELNKDLKRLAELGYKYVFIDEVTLLEDFIDGASLFSDVYAMCGMKIVLSGTDSLGFAISEREELYDRSVTIHTTFIPFREYSRLLGIRDIDEYIRYGGTFSVGETDFDDPQLMSDSASFRDDESTRRYIDTAIARNIQHSLACYQSGGHLMHLLDLYEARELTGAINRIIKDMNHSFLVSVLTEDFKSHDLGSAAQLERKQAAREFRNSVLDEIDVKSVTERLMNILEIRNRTGQRVKITEEHVREIREYLSILDLIIDIPEHRAGAGSEVVKTAFTQPGMRFCQAQALVHSLMKDEIFAKYPAVERRRISDKILEDVKGRMLEEIVLLETLKVMPRNKRVFKMKFAVGEIDMVIADEEEVTCDIYEIKHTDRPFGEQYKNLIDQEKCRILEHDYGEICSKTVLYRGEDAEIDGVHYRNVEKYLEGLKA